MDLSDGSDAEDEVQGQGTGYYVNEDDLLEGSDDEEPAPVTEDRQVVPQSRGLNDEEDLLYSDHDEDEDEFLDLRAGDDDDELGLGNDTSAVAEEGITPLKVPIRTTVVEEESKVTQADEASASDADVTPAEEFENNHEVEGEGESHLDESNTEKTEDTNDEDDEDEEEGKTQRSRFHSERKPITASENSGNSFMGKPQPIRSLGYQHNNRGNSHHQNHQGQRNWGPQNGVRQFHRGFNNHRGQRHPQRMMMHHMQMQRNGMLGPRPEMMQHHQNPGPRLLGPPGVHPGGAPVVQFSSEIFTDFNTPVRTPGHIRPSPQNQQPPVPGSQIPTVQVNPVARPGVGIVRPQPVANNNPNNNAGQPINKPMQAQAPNQQPKQMVPAAPQTQKQNNPFFPQQQQNQGPRNNSQGQGSRPVWKGRLRPPVPQNMPNPNQINNNNLRPPHPQFPGPLPPGSFDQPGNNVGLGAGPNRFGPPGNNVHLPIQNLQPPGAETGHLMNNGPPQGFGGPPIRQPTQQQRPPPALINPNPFQRPNRPFLGSPQQQQGPGMTIPVMQQQHGQMPMQMQPRSPFDHFPGQNAPRLMGHPYPPDPEFRNQAPVGQRPQGPEMYNMVPPPHQQFGPRFGQVQEPMFNPNQQALIRHQFFGEPLQQPQFHPDPNMMNYMQGPPGGFSPYGQQFQQPMPPMNTMVSLQHYTNQYGLGGNQQNYQHMDRERDRERERDELEAKYGVKLPFKRKKDNKTLSEEFIAFNNPAKHQRLHDRLGPPPARKTEIYNQDQADEIVKIIVETKKEMGIDDDYMKQIEEQKRKRAEILKLKAERMRSAKDEDSGSGAKQSRHDDSRSTSQSASRTVRKVEAPGKSIYINPAAFKGDLSVLNNNLRRINMSISSDSMSHSQQSSVVSRTSAQASSRVASSSVSGSQARSVTTSSGRTVITSPREASPQVVKKKPKTILRVTKNKKGEVLYMEKLSKVEKTSSVHTHTHHK